MKFINCNITAFDAAKHAGVSVLGDARAVLEALRSALKGWSVEVSYRAEATALAEEWDRTVEHAYCLGHVPLPAQSEVIGAVNAACGPHDVMVCAAGSMPGDLHKLWRTSDPKGYHVEYGYSCMGYEIAGGLGVKMAAPDREVFVLVGDGSYLMMAQELVTAVQEGVKLTVVLVQNYGFASIGSLSDSIGSERFGTSLRYRDPATGRLNGDVLPIDLTANAASLGVVAMRVRTIGELTPSLRHARREVRSLSRSRRIRSFPLRTATHGGTCRWPKFPSSSRPCGRERLTNRPRRTKGGTGDLFSSSRRRSSQFHLSRAEVHRTRARVGGLNLRYAEDFRGPGVAAPFRAVPRDSLVGSRAQPDKAVVERDRGLVRDDADRRVTLQRQHRLAWPTVVSQGPEPACTIADIAFCTPQAGSRCSRRCNLRRSRFRQPGDKGR